MSTDTRIALADFDLVPVPACGTRTLICLQRAVGDDECMCRYGTRTVRFFSVALDVCVGTVRYGSTVRYRSLVNVLNDDSTVPCVSENATIDEKRSTVRYEYITRTSKRWA